MREILFRGKRKDSGEWVEGSLITFANNTGAAILKSKSKAYMPKNDTTFCTTSCFEVIPETVGQFTGLTDRNGKKIFEGDIVKQIYGDDLVYIVTWDEMRALFYLKSNRGIVDFYHCFGEELEVIGNIHDNPELIGNENGMQKQEEQNERK